MLFYCMENEKLISMSSNRIMLTVGFLFMVFPLFVCTISSGLPVLTCTCASL